MLLVSSLKCFDAARHCLQGAPGTGKTTLLRDVAHLLADTFQCVLRGSCIQGDRAARHLLAAVSLL